MGGNKSRHCTYYVTLRRVHAIIATMEKQYVPHIPRVHFVVFGVQHEMHMHDVVICGLPGSAVLFHIIP